MNNNSNNTEEHWLAVFLKSPTGILLVLISLVLVIYLVLKNCRLPKRDLVHYYGIDKKTFGKWINHFCQDIIGNIQVYKRKRKISAVEYYQIKWRLGNPKDYPILSKKEIIKRAEGTYYSLQGCIKSFPNEYGLSYEAYLSMNKFPPNISQKIIKTYE